MRIKPNKLPRLCIIVTFLSYFVISNLVKTTIAQNSQEARKEKVRDILNDLPLKLDLGKYVNRLGKIIDFVDSNRIYVDTTFAFNLFLININLKAILNVKENKLDYESVLTLQQILQKNDDCIQNFHNIYQNYVEKLDPGASVTHIPELFSNEITFTKHLKRFKNRLLADTKFYSPEELRSMFPAFKNYVKSLNYKHYFLNPMILDDCINQLANVSANDENTFIQCEIDTSCQLSVLEGSNSGYEIIQRLLYLIMARHGRGCNVIDTKLDKKIMDDLCVKIYNEAEFLAYKKFEIPRLSMLQINICSLEGHVQFLRRTWIEELLKPQIEFGCMRLVTLLKLLRTMNSSSEYLNWEIMHTNGEIFGGSCNSHSTGSAAVMLATAIRYILETFY